MSPGPDWIRRSFLVPVSVAVAGAFAKGAAAQPAPVVLEPRREAAVSSARLIRELVALPRAAAQRPADHFSHSSHASHVSHASHMSHFSSSTAPPTISPPPITSGSGGVATTQATAQSSDLERAIEQHGITYQGVHKQITTAICAGEAQYGARWVGYTLEYHRFSCTLFDASYNLYEAEVAITRANSQYFWWKILTIRSA